MSNTAWNDLTQKLSVDDIPSFDPEAALDFGKFFAPFMAQGHWTKNLGWGDFELDLVKELSYHPGAAVFHYAQTVFEGLKAYYGHDGKVRIFRPDYHAKRLQRSAERVCLPALDEKIFIESVAKVSEKNRDWIPKKPGQSLYLRPFIMGSEAFLGVKPSTQVSYMVIASPVGNYYARGENSLRILIETEDVRASVGGIGFAKTGANYAASLRAGQRAKQHGLDQVLWLDAKERKYIEEVGTMNIFFVTKDKIITPALNGSILNGCTRDSVITLLKHWNLPIEERSISLDEVNQLAKNGELEEIFGSGTAAVIAAVGELCSLDGSVSIKSNENTEVSKRLKNHLVGLQRGDIKDEFGWCYVLEN